MVHGGDLGVMHWNCVVDRNRVMVRSSMINWSVVHYSGSMMHRDFMVHCRPVSHYWNC